MADLVHSRISRSLYGCKSRPGAGFCFPRLSVISSFYFLDRRLDPSSQIQVIGPDITERDNSLLSLAVSRIDPAFCEIFDRQGIDKAGLLRMVYRMAGELTPAGKAPAMQRRPLKPLPPQPASKRRGGERGEEGGEDRSRDPLIR